MKRGVKIKVEKDLLLWARDAMGYSLDKAAEKSKIDKKDLKQWEAQTSEITFPDIKKIAKAYKRQVSFFFLPSAPTEKPIPPDFRTLDSEKLDELPEEVRLAVRRAQANRKTINELFPDEYKQKITREISLTDDPIEVAKIFRQFFSLTIAQQFAQKDEKESLAYWIEAVEEKGISVFQMDLGKQFRGFCLRGNNLPPVIVINAKEARAGKTFTLLHELCHLRIKQSDIDAVLSSKEEAIAHRTIEAFANEFAGSFLVPYEALVAQPLFKTYKEKREPACIPKLAKKFNVSELVIFKRMLSLGVITKAEYEKEKKILDDKFEQLKLLEKKRREENPDSFVPRNVPRETIQKIGLSLGEKTFQAVSDGRMTTFDLAQFLDVKTHHLDGIRSLIEKKYNSLA